MDDVSSFLIVNSKGITAHKLSVAMMLTSIILSLLFISLRLQQTLGFGHLDLAHVHHTHSLLENGSLLLSSDWIGQYQSALKSKPLATQVQTGGILAVVGDAIAQKTSEEDGYDTKRAVSFALFDGAYRIVQHYLYPPMIAVCNGNTLGALLGPALGAATEQALASQLLIIPLFYYPCFYAMTGLVQGLSVSETVERAKERFWPLMRRNWLYWIPVQFGVFAFCKDEAAQISILIACGLVWTIILSTLAGDASEDEDTPAVSFNEDPAVEMSKLAGSRKGTITPTLDFERGASVERVPVEDDVNTRR